MTLKFNGILLHFLVKYNAKRFIFKSSDRTAHSVGFCNVGGQNGVNRIPVEINSSNLEEI